MRDYSCRTYHKVDAVVIENEVELFERFLVRVLLSPCHRPQAHLAHDQLALAQLMEALIKDDQGMKQVEHTNRAIEGTKQCLV